MTPIKGLAILAVAERDIEQALDWYDAQRSGLGKDFLAELDEIFRNIRQHPEMYQTAIGQARRAGCRNYPYSVLYRILPDRIEITGVLHMQANPEQLRARSHIRHRDS